MSFSTIFSFSTAFHRLSHHARRICRIFAGIFVHVNRLPGNKFPAGLITKFDSIYDFTAKSYLFFSGVKSSSMTFHAASTLKYSRMYFWVSSHILRHSAGS